MKKPYDYLIVGSGLTGATFAFLAHEHGRRCLVLERRAHTGGNTYCQEMAGIRVHRYGAHILHTNNTEVWNFICRHVEMNRYTNSPLANYHGKLYNLPFNMNTFHQMWGVNTPEEAKEIIERQKQESLTEAVLKHGPNNLEEQAISLVGNDIYRTLIQGYTQKQWGRSCTELPAHIIRRLPLRFVYDNNYFNDRYQGIPVGGYNTLLDKLLQGSDVRLSTDFLNDANGWKQQAEHVIYTGPIDAYFDYKLGHLQYRTVQFEHQTLDTPNYQGCAVVNYTDAETPFTRIIEHKHFESFGEQVYANPQTVVSREYSVEWKPGIEPYYPIEDERNLKLFDAYRTLAKGEKDITFAGRLAEYKYYDMAPTIERSMSLFKALDGND